MAMFAVVIEGLKSFDDMDKLDPAITRLARMAVNDTTRWAQRTSARKMEQQVNFPKGYLTGEDGRLSIAQYATDSKLQGIVRGRDRPTSLARFVVGGAKKKVGERGGVSVAVDPGIAKFMPSAFVIKLRNNNLGLAFYSKSGKVPDSHGAKKLSKNTWLLYGPDVSQVFNLVRQDLVPEAAQYLEDTFDRLVKAGI